MFTVQNYRRWLRLSILVIYLIIIAGAVVRMTGSGMGCPDWPKCFGYWIPPTEEAELEFSPNTSYKKGMVIIVDEELRVARQDFFTTDSYSESNWQPYAKHDYAIFNKFHTWTEYINRLIGALGGFVVLFAAILSLQFIRTRPKLTVLTVVALLAMLIQAVIGKIVVDTLLSPVLITIHMIVALLIVGLLIYLLYEVLPANTKYRNDGKLSKVALGIIILTLVQVAMGTQVRQFIDHQVDLFGYPLSSEWLENGPIIFFIHRSFSIVLLLLHAWFIFVAVKTWNHPGRSYSILAALLLITISSGVIMNYFDFALASQPIHLVVASLILGLQFYIWMRLRSARIKA
ncbi:cytochrome oxidase assembly protein [Nonlabens sp. YIK11]|nr:cytochrome oxidase assembly protein [Nonlabens sp. YIK11]